MPLLSFESLSPPIISYLVSLFFCDVQNLKIVRMIKYTVCAEYNHVRSWGVTRFRGMISTQPGSTSLASFKVLYLLITVVSFSTEVSIFSGANSRIDRRITKWLCWCWWVYKGYWNGLPIDDVIPSHNPFLQVHTVIKKAIKYSSRESSLILINYSFDWPVMETGIR